MLSAAITYQVVQQESFMQAARWPDDIRMNDKQYHKAPWVREPELVNEHPNRDG
jgi:hypothetical protein